MPIDRFTDLEFLSPEMVDRIERKVAAAYRAVQNDPQQVATVKVVFTMRGNTLGDVDGDFIIEQKQADRGTSEMGKIRDGQLVLPGTGLRSEEDPPAWEDRMLAAPTAGRK